MTFNDACVDAIDWAGANKTQAKALIAMEYTSLLRAMNLENAQNISKHELIRMIVHTFRSAGATEAEISFLLQTPN